MLRAVPLIRTRSPKLAACLLRQSNGNGSAPGAAPQAGGGGGGSGDSKALSRPYSRAGGLDRGVCCF